MCNCAHSGLAQRLGGWIGLVVPHNASPRLPSEHKASRFLYRPVCECGIKKRKIPAVCVCVCVCVRACMRACVVEPDWQPWLNISLRSKVTQKLTEQRVPTAAATTENTNFLLAGCNDPRVSFVCILRVQQLWICIWFLCPHCVKVTCFPPGLPISSSSTFQSLLVTKGLTSVQHTVRGEVQLYVLCSYVIHTSECCCHTDKRKQKQ